MVGGAITDSAPTTEPRVRAFPSRGSSEYGPLSLAPWACGSVDAPLESEDVPLDVLPGERIPVFSTCSHVCHKTRTPSAPLSSRTPAPRQQPVLSKVEGYPRHYSGPWLLGDILPIDACGWFPAPVVLESHRWVTPFRASTLRGLRSVLYAGSRIECRLISIGKPGRGVIPFWACLSASFGRLCLTTPHHTFTCVDHSRVLGGVVTSGSC
jgi:hypothetical protein